MAAFNQVILLGNVTRDPEVKYLPSQTAVAEFGLAVNRKFRTGSGEDKEEVCFVDCTAFGKQAEVIGQHVTKGKPLFVEGRLKFDQWEKDGQKRSKLSVVVNNFQFIGGRDGGNGGGQDDAQPRQQNRQQSRRPQQSERQQSQADRAWGDDQHFTEADIPF